MSEPVGYKSPPAQSRWKKGQSGNPTGRKKGTANLKTDLAAELAEIIQINEGGSPRKITKQRALLKSLAVNGIKGDTRSANLLLNLILRVLLPDPEAVADAPLAPADQALLDEYVAKNYDLKGTTP